jgi:hypothetical protein
MLTAGPRDQFPRWCCSRRRLSVCSVFRCPDLWLQCSVSFVHGLKMKHHIRITYFLNRAWNSRCTVITPQNGAHRKPSPAATPSLKLVPLPRSKHEKRTASSAWETWTVSVAQSVCCVRVGWAFETAPFFCVRPALCTHLPTGLKDYRMVFTAKFQVLIPGGRKFDIACSIYLCRGTR